MDRNKELEESAARILTLNRFLRTISDINQLIVRETDHQRLLEETCRIIVERGGFRLAWIGQVDFQTLEVIPVAQAGFEEGYLETARIRFDDSPRGSGPVGRALKTKQPTVCLDTETDTCFAPWREAARLQGYRAMAAFPLMNKDRLWGSINIYAGDPTLFSGEMVHLLQELADDLSFALQALEERKARQKAEAALKESEARYRDLYDQAPDMYLSVSADTGLVTDCNQTLCAVTGFTREEFIGRSVFSLYHPDFLDRVRNNFQKFLAEGEIRDAVLPALGKDGRVLWVSLNATAVRDEQGRIRQSRSIWRDITRQREAEGALREREAKIQSIFRAAPVGIGLVSYPDRLLLEVNDLLCRMVGYTPEELIGQSARMLYPTDEDFHRVRRDKYSQIEAQGTGTVETRWQRKDGAVIDVLLSSTPLDPADYSAGVTFTALEITARKQAEAALRSEEEKYRLHFENVFDVIYSLDRELKFREVSPSVERAIGYAPEELIGKSLAELNLLSPRSWEQALADIQMILDGGRLVSREYEILARDGSVKWGEVSSQPLMVQGKVIGIVCVARDITEKRRDKEALQVLAQQWQTTFDAMMDIVCLLDAESRIVQCNRSMKEFLKKTSEEILGRPCWEVMHRKVAPLDQCPSIRMFQTRQRETLELEIAGRWFEITADPIFNAEGQITGAVHILSDRTERIKMEQALRESEERFRNIFENAVEGIFQSSPAGRYLRVNPSQARMFGYSSPEEMVASVSDIGRELYVHPEDREKLKELLERYPIVHNFEVQRLKKDRSSFWTAVNIRSVRDESGKTLYYEGFTQDITERKQAEEARVSLEQQLRQAQKLEAIGTLAGGIAHDFNNILGAVIGFSELARMDIPEGSPAREDLDQVLKAAQRAKDLVRQILTFSRKGSEELAPVDVTPIIKEALKLLRASLPTTIAIRQQVRLKDAVVQADPVQIHQILMNLCANAAQAMDQEGGELEVTLSEAALGPEDLPSDPGRPPGRYLELSVRDTGPGIPAEILEHIFEPYFTTKQKGVGTGLGLSVVHGIVQRHGGLIRVESHPGSGARFRVYLPLLTGIQPVAPKAEPAPAPGREHILVVDDEAVLTVVMKKTLEHLGYRVTVFNDAQEALDFFRSEPDAVQLVVTDMTMPKLTGDRLAEKILQIRPRLPLIICTGYSERLSDGRIKEIGARTLLMKPIELKTLAQRIREILDKRDPG